ncbi:hypothetical protein Pcinc_020682 [Petrolisthes cinctipes]|uniref:Uncharacterized protein n=1 Tax=Petrolisthes cinctipes TaxID=88211 RepID=A0AAE1KJM3_PETCI|nr:hypothetical protein Pcinc_020682 [Petrolisthes cinctipes]
MPKQDKNVEGKRKGSGKKATAPAGEWGNAVVLASSAAFRVSRQAKIKTNKRTDAEKRAKANAQELLRQGIAVKPPLPSSQPVAATPPSKEVMAEREDVPTLSGFEEDVTMSGDEGTRQEEGRELPSAKDELLEEAVAMSPPRVLQKTFTSGSPGCTSKRKRKVGTPLTPR